MRPFDRVSCIFVVLFPLQVLCVPIPTPSVANDIIPPLAIAIVSLGLLGRGGALHKAVNTNVEFKNDVAEIANYLFEGKAFATIDYNKKEVLFWPSSELADQGLEAVRTEVAKLEPVFLNMLAKRIAGGQSGKILMAKLRSATNNGEGQMNGDNLVMNLLTL
jgi:hypothetical protein